MGLPELQRLADLFAELLQNERVRALAPDGKKSLRKWTGPEVARLVGGVSLDTLYRRLKKDSSLPQGTVVSPRRREFTLEEIHQLQLAFGLLPRRLPGDETQTWLACNFKGGVAKTTTAINLAQSNCLAGLNGLFVDLDPQGSATQCFGISPFDVQNSDTVLPYLEGPSINGIPNEDWTGTLTSAIRPTHWHGIDFLPASMALFGGDFAIAKRAIDMPGFPFHRMLRDGLLEIKQSGKYDYILVDTAPSLAFLNTAALFSADVLLLPVPPAPLDIHSAGLFFQTLAATVEPLDQVEPQTKIYDALIMLFTKFKAKDDTHVLLSTMLREKFPHITLISEMVQTSALEKLGYSILTPYEAETFAGDRRTLERALESLNAVNQELRDVMVNIWRRKREAKT